MHKELSFTFKFNPLLKYLFLEQFREQKAFSPDETHLKTDGLRIQEFFLLLCLINTDPL